MPAPDELLESEGIAEGVAEPCSPAALARVLEQFLAQHPAAAVLEDGKVVFDFSTAQHRVTTDSGQCTLQLWSAERNLVRAVISAEERKDDLRLRTRRFGHRESKTLTLVPAVKRREPNRREPARQGFMKLLTRVLLREFPEWSAESFSTAMDLERSFGPAYARGALVRGREAWAVIGAGPGESQAVIDGILTLGVLWLEACRERGGGKSLFQGLRIVVPRGTGMLTLARLPWMNESAAKWELFELDPLTEELRPCDVGDHGNLHTRLVHHPDRAAAQERFAAAITAVRSLVPPGQAERVEQRLRSTAELAFLLHGLEFASARISLSTSSFAHLLEVRVGVGPQSRVLCSENHMLLTAQIEELFARRNSQRVDARPLRPHTPGRSIGAFTGRPAHARMAFAAAPATRPTSRWDQRREALPPPQQDPLFRASPERWLESMLRENLAPLTRSLAPAPQSAAKTTDHFANDRDPETWGNRVDPDPWASAPPGRIAGERLIPRFDPRFVYTQVPAIAGAGDRGMLDLLGMTEDGRLAVIEVKAADDLQLVMQGLDYWIRVRHHCTPSSSAGEGAGLNDLQRHGYFSGVSLSPLSPRLFLVAPALHVHPAIETILRFLSPRVEWTLLALDERWRRSIRVVWRKSGGNAVSASLPAC